MQQQSGDGAVNTAAHGYQDFSISAHRVKNERQIYEKVRGHPRLLIGNGPFQHVKLLDGHLVCLLITRPPGFFQKPD
jgi:hypothetical protein